MSVFKSLNNLYPGFIRIMYEGLLKQCFVYPGPVLKLLKGRLAFEELSCGMTVVINLKKRQISTLFFSISSLVGARDGAMVRALASHQCGPGSIPGLAEFIYLFSCSPLISTKYIRTKDSNITEKGPKISPNDGKKTRIIHY